MQQIKRIGPNS